MDTAVSQHTLNGDRDLLARVQAAQQALAIQVEVANRSLEKLAAENEKFQADRRALASVQVALAKLQKQLPEAIRYNTESIAKLHAQISQVAETMSAERGGLADSGALDDLKEGLAQLQQHTETSIGQLSDRLSEIDRQLVEQAAIAPKTADLVCVHEALNRLKQERASTASAKELSVTAIEELKTRLGQLGTRLPAAVQSNTEAIANLQEQVAHLSIQLAKLPAALALDEPSAEIESLRADVEQLSQQMNEASWGEQIAHLEAAIAALDPSGAVDLAPLQAQIAALEASLSALPDTTSQNARAIAALQEKIGKLEKRLVKQSSKRGNSLATNKAIAELRSAVSKLKHERVQSSQQPQPSRYPPSAPPPQSNNSAPQTSRPATPLPPSPEPPRQPSTPNAVSSRSESSSPSSPKKLEPLESVISTVIGFFCK
ncbi:hypothetical protein [Synechococcus sp. PCC 7336]|uniref:hypothetical protein n=1 Tax=Synechococcus sp. PCC 7336 TaxID=195250 RepID=UPI00034824C2|nr:hypothetical protein [Synechococcus sp. PCC 7336]